VKDGDTVKARDNVKPRDGVSSCEKNELGVGSEESDNEENREVDCWGEKVGGRDREETPLKLGLIETTDVTVVKGELVAKTKVFDEVGELPREGLCAEVIVSTAVSVAKLFVGGKEPV